MNTAALQMEVKVLNGRRAASVINLRPARAAALIYAENRLFPWAAWARNNRETLGLPTISMLYKAMKQRSKPVGRARDVHLTARGNGTRSMQPITVGEVPEAVAEVDLVVARLPEDLHEVLVADFFTYGPIEVRCRATRWKRARYSQLLECAKYAVFASLMAKS